MTYVDDPALVVSSLFQVGGTLRVAQLWTAAQIRYGHGRICPEEFREDPIDTQTVRTTLGSLCSIERLTSKRVCRHPACPDYRMQCFERRRDGVVLPRVPRIMVHVVARQRCVTYAQVVELDERCVVRLND